MDEIVTYSIVRLGEVLFPQIIPLVGDAPPPGLVERATKSPKFTPFPVDAMVTYSIVL